MASLLDVVLLRRADEQTERVDFRGQGRPRKRTAASPAVRICAVPGCAREFPAVKHSTICPECKAKGLCGLPCEGCGGPLRDLDRKHRPNNLRTRHRCQTCRATMDVPLSSGTWRKGQSGNPNGRAA